MLSWRVFTAKRLLPLRYGNLQNAKNLYSTRGNLASKSTVRLTMMSAGVGAIIGVGYSGYTHYKINKKKSTIDKLDYPTLDTAPNYRPTSKMFNPADTTKLKLVLFQYRTCPFCCKVRAFLDYHGFSYEIVEVDAVLRQDIKWSKYKKVPMLLAKIDGRYTQLMESSAIISLLATYLEDKEQSLTELLKYYPISSFTNDDGKNVTDVVNKYFLMHKKVTSEDDRKEELIERKWRQWSDQVLVHALSPNVYRTMEEAYQAFNWFAEVGHWREHFPAWECYLMVNVGAFVMWIIGKRLKKRHNLKDDVRLSLYDAANEWMRELKTRGTPFMGGKKPSLADLSVFGILSSIEGCNAFKDLRNNTKIGLWFDAVKHQIESNQGRYISFAANSQTDISLSY